MRRLLFLVSVLALSTLVAPAADTEEALPQNRPLVLAVRLDNEAITPATARFITRAFQQAQQQQAVCLILVLDTPGGLVESTREVVKAILHSKVPIVVYVRASMSAR